MRYFTTPTFSSTVIAGVFHFWQKKKKIPSTSQLFLNSTWGWTKCQHHMKKNLSAFEASHLFSHFLVRMPISSICEYSVYCVCHTTGLVSTVPLWWFSSPMFSTRLFDCLPGKITAGGFDLLTLKLAYQRADSFDKLDTILRYTTLISLWSNYQVT